MAFLQRVLGLLESTGISKNKLVTTLGINKNSFVDWENRGNIPSGDVVNSGKYKKSCAHELGKAKDE